mgnify:CR=1 FL=1
MGGRQYAECLICVPSVRWSTGKAVKLAFLADFRGNLSGIGIRQSGACHAKLGKPRMKKMKACFFPSFVGGINKAWQNGDVKASWNKWEGSRLCREGTVYAAKGLDRPVRRTDVRAIKQQDFTSKHIHAKTRQLTI